MLKPEHLQRAVDLQQRSYALLRWVADSVDQGALTFKVAHGVASLPDAAHAWLSTHYATLPRAVQPAREDLRAFANLFSSYLESSFDLVEDRGKQLHSPDAHCFCPLCCWLVDAPRLKTKKLSPRDKQRARTLQADAITALALQHDLASSADRIEALLARRDLYEAAALVAYALELVRRMQDAGSGPAALALWRAFAWTVTGSPKHGFELRAQAIFDAEAALLAALRGTPAHVTVLASASDALRLLATLGASAWLVRHHELVVEAAEQLCDRIARGFSLRFDRRHVLTGAALHDAGKIVHPVEMTQPGSEHEAAGERLLLDHGVEPAVARCCVTHATWTDPRATVEDLLVALADKLWKGKRDEALELALAERIVTHVGGERWALMSRVDAICEAVAEDAPERLERSRV